MAHRAFSTAIVATSLVAASLPGWAQDAASGTSQSIDDVSRKLADPTAALISVPLQFNYMEGMGPNGNLHNTVLKLQPVIPLVGESGTFIVRECGKCGMPGSW